MGDVAKLCFQCDGDRNGRMWSQIDAPSGVMDGCGQGDRASPEAIGGTERRMVDEEKRSSRRDGPFQTCIMGANHTELQGSRVAARAGC